MAYISSLLAAAALRRRLVVRITKKSAQKNKKPTSRCFAAVGSVKQFDWS
jgi:hypothetical protein